MAQKRSVHKVHTFAGGLGRILVRLARILHVSPCAKCLQGPEMRFESHLGHTVSAGQGRAGLVGVDKTLTRPVWKRLGSSLRS
jgi:hypothetical protein